MSVTSTRLRRSGAGIAVAALVGSGLLLTPSAQAAEKTLTELDVNLSYTRAAGSNTFLADGVRVKTVGATSQSKAAGYFDTDVSLADSGNPSLAWSGTAARPGTQLIVDFDGDGDTDGTLVGEPAYGANWWLPGNTLAGTPVDPAIRAAAPKVSGGGSADNGPLGDWRAAFPEAEISQAGWSLGSGVEGEGTINRISIGNDDFYFSQAAVGRDTLRRSDVSQRDTRAQGRNTFRPTGGVRINTFNGPANGSATKATGYFRVAEPLADVGEPTWTYESAEGSEPGKQLIIDLDGSSSTTDDRGTLVGETAYGKDWWLTNGSSAKLKDLAPKTGTGSGSNWFGTLNEWRLKAPDASVLEAGWSLGSGLLGDGVLTSFRVGQTVYSFAGNRAPAAADVSGAIREGGAAIRIPLKGTDPDTSVYTDVAGLRAVADTLTYTVAGAEGTATIDGDVLVYSVGAVDSDSTDEFTYTVTDDRGASATAAVTVAVTAQATPVAGTIDASATIGKEATVTLTSTISDGSPVTYTTTEPGATITGGNKLTFTPTAAGSKNLAFTATSQGGSSNGTVRLTVAKAASTTALSVPKSFKVKTSTKATVTVTSAYAVAGDTVDLFMSGSKIGTGKLGADKKVTITFKVAKSGAKRVVVAKYLGNANTLPSEKSATVKVTK